MITDAENTLSASQAVTAAAVSANTIDLSQARDLGAGEELNVVINVEAAALAAGAATVQFQVISSANSNLSSATVLGQTDAIPKASLGAGAQIVVPVPRALINQLGQRYLGLNYNVGTGPLTQGTFSAFLVIDVPDNTGAMKKVYPSGWSIK